MFNQIILIDQNIDPRTFKDEISEEAVRDIVALIPEKIGLFMVSHADDAWIEPVIRGISRQYGKMGKKIVNIETNYHSADKTYTEISFLPKGIAMEPGSPEDLLQSIKKARTENPDIIVIQPVRNSETLKVVFELAKKYLVISSIHCGAESTLTRFDDMDISRQIVSSVPVVILGKHYKL